VAYSDPAVIAGSPGYHFRIATAEEAAGHLDKADALVKSAGTSRVPVRRASLLTTTRATLTDGWRCLAESPSVDHRKSRE
jgi:hypothetical protein